MEKATEERPASVRPEGERPEESKQAGESRPRWWWVQPRVWTMRMLAALETGVKGGKWFSLMDKVYRFSSLLAGFRKVAANKGAPGVDHVTIDTFEKQLLPNLSVLERSLKDGTYRPQPVLRVHIPKPGSKEMRPLGIPTVRDRVVQSALRDVLEPIFERDFADHSYGFRPGRGCHHALRRVEDLLAEGYRYVVDADLKSYFDTIDHSGLLELIGHKVSDGKVLALIEAYLKQGVLEGMREWTPEKGSPQGAVISPLLSNIYLDPLDHRMARLGYRMIRYADDFVILCRSRQEAEEALREVAQWVEEANLVLHPTKTRVVDAVAEGFEFLGYRFAQGRRWPRKKSLAKLKDAVRVKTRRANGHSLSCIIARLNPTLRGWFTYFRYSDPVLFKELDGWVRGRLRGVLRKRRKGKGRGRGHDHRRWTNAFFTAHGFFSMKVAREKIVQPAWR